MKLSIERTLGIINAEIDLEPGRIVEVVGPNASGKTSIAVCAQAVLARESNPLGLSAADAKRSYPHDGADDAQVELTDENGTGVTWYPIRSTVLSNHGDVQYANPEAVGLIDFTAKRGAKERSAVFQGALLPDPDTVLEAVKERLGAYLDPKDLAGAMAMLAERGWEATEAVYGDRARVAKREWAAIAGRTYGVRVAADWRPDGWLADFDHMTPQIAEERVTNARDALNALHRVQAISESEQEAAERAAADLPGLEAHLAELTAERDKVLADRDAIPTMTAADRRNRLQNQIDEERRNLSAVHQCPHCAGHLAIRQGQIVIGDDSALVQSRIDEFVTQHDEADAELEKLTAADRPLIHQLQTLDASKSASESTLAQCRREAAKTGTVQTEADRAALAQAEQAVEDTREVVRLVKAEADATRLHETIVRYTEIARALGPEGVRAKMMATRLRTLNSGLRVIHDASKNANGLPTWPLVYISENGSISSTAYGNRERPITICSESERWRAQAAIQLTLGAITGSKAVVLDRADLLDAGNRAGLVCAVNRVASKTGMAVLLCSTGTPMDDAPWRQLRVADGVVA